MKPAAGFDEPCFSLDMAPKMRGSCLEGWRREGGSDGQIHTVPKSYKVLHWAGARGLISIRFPTSSVFCFFFFFFGLHADLGLV